MADSTNDIVIRPFDARKDLREVQMLLGMGSMEQLATANRLAYLHPVSISIWLVCAGAMIQALRLWPNGSGPNGWLGYLAPLPILACTALPVLFGVDWLHRPIFEDLLKSNIQNFTKSIAIRNSSASSRKSLHLVMEYKKAPIGCAFIEPVDSKSQRPAYRITHFYVDTPYRHTGVGNDLLSHAVKQFKEAKSEIVGVTTRLMPYTIECLQTGGFIRNNRGVEIWDQGKRQEEDRDRKEGDKVGVDEQNVFLVDTRRTGWVLHIV